MKHINPKEIPVPELFATLLGATAPRPIAYVSTIDEKGNHNLAPFSFFNMFGANPPTIVFSPSRKGRDNTTKHTYENVKVIPEAVVNVVNFDMVHQTSLSSNDFPRDVSEFKKAGFTPIESELVKPMRVAESPVQMECKVLQVIETGDLASAGNLVICEIIKIHINENVLTPEGKIDQHKINLVGRLGGNYYCRASGSALFEVAKPGATPSIGVDSLPENVKSSRILTGNDLGQLGSLKKMPTQDEIKEAKNDEQYINLKNDETKIHLLAQELIAQGKLVKAYSILM
ncbi:MAG: flavin reductase [Salinivirgaceae bacterium]|nr:MAG: flavin reductase [Salinivirgaceae bacterium]